MREKNSPAVQVSDTLICEKDERVGCRRARQIERVEDKAIFKGGMPEAIDTHRWRARVRGHMAVPLRMVNVVLGTVQIWEVWEVGVAAVRTVD